MKLSTVILAAGKGTRMKSSLPKVLHPLAGRPLVGHVIDSAKALNAEAVHVVYGHGGERVPQAFDGAGVEFVLQAEQLGTGHAVDQAMPNIEDDHLVLVLYGDVPLIRQETLAGLVEAAGDSSLGLLTVTLANPTGYGRIVRDSASGQVQCIVEQKDADAEQLKIREVNTGILAVNAGLLRNWLNRLDNKNAQGEYYLTDIIAMAVADGVAVNTRQPQDATEVEGINDRVQLSRLERRYQELQAEQLMRAGVTLADPARIDVRGNLKIGQDSFIDINVVIEGDVEIGSGVSIGPNCLIRNSRIGDCVEILANTVIEEAVVGEASRVGPFARLRPQAELLGHNHVGNFVEIKKSTIGEGSKVNHLSYVGDAQIGNKVNVGAGTITCNYDGANKHLTEIGDNAFIGSNTALVAPVKIGAGATIGAGSVINSDAPDEQLTVTRAKQISIPAWKRPVKASKS